MAGAEASRFTRVDVPVTLGRVEVASLLNRLEAALEDPQTSAIVLFGARDAFCRGMDLEEIEVDIAEGERPWTGATASFARVLEGLAEAPKPTLAVVEGQATGGGVGLAAACDFVIASHRATFSLPEVVLGLAPAMVLSILADRLGFRCARRWAMTAVTWDGDEAHRAGLVDEVFEPNEIEAGVARCLRRLGRCHPRGVAAVKALSLELARLSLKEGILRGQATLDSLLDDADVRAGVVAFREYGLIPAQGEG
jgi:enoyl-CoA hydratase/carnithine racemase